MRRSPASSVVAVEELEPHPGCLDPLGDLVALSEDPFVLRALDHQRRVRECRVLPAVIEVQMRVDHDGYIGRCEPVVGERIGDRAIDHLEVAEHLVGATAPGVDEHDAELLMEDHVAVDRPGLGRDEQVPEVETLDLHRLLLRIRGLRPEAVPTAGSV